MNPSRKLEIMAIIEQLSAWKLTIGQAAEKIDALYNSKQPAADGAELKDDLWHMVEVDGEEIHILHVSGCNSEKGTPDPECRVMQDLINNRPQLAPGEYDAKAIGMEKIKYTPREKLATSSQRGLAL